MNTANDLPLLLAAKDAVRYGESALGGKARNMAWLSRNGFPVPAWCAVTTSAFRAHLAQDGLAAWIDARLDGIRADSPDVEALSGEIRDRIVRLPLPAAVTEALSGYLATLPGWENDSFAVRSSAVGEDALAASFAGQMDSFLFQRGMDALLDSIRACFASAFTARALRYRLHHKFALTDIQAAVIVQRMVIARVSGVFFTAHPITGSRRSGLISACYGIGEGIVSGQCTTDEFTVELYGDRVESIINCKDVRIVFDRETGRGTREEAVPADMQQTPCLTSQEIAAIVRAGRTIAEKLHFPQDIEWAFEGDDLYILQTRPVTSLPKPALPLGETVVWDNSNIQESYCGVTTPLTFSFANRGYSIVYEQTLRVVRTPDKTIEEMRPFLQNMLGLIRGRVYYNINNWYRGLLVLPGFKTNKKDMERMMGLQDPVDFVVEPHASFPEKVKKLFALFKTLFYLLMSFRRIDRLVAGFRAMFEVHYRAVDREKLHTLEIPELMKLLEELKQLMYNWETPIINDMYVMMMNGKVARWLENSGIEYPVILQNNLMSGEEGIESTEPTKFILRLCDDIRKKPALMELIQRTDNLHLLGVLQGADPDLHARCMEYIELYGDRCIGELKLESITLRQDASFLFAIVKNYLSRVDLSLETLANKEMQFRQDAETEAFTKVKEHHGRRGLGKFKHDLKRLRQAVKNRENMRLMRTRSFGMARDIYVEIGTQLAFYGLLGEPRDIFYLTVEEIEQFVEGRSVHPGMKSLVKARREEFDSYRDQELSHHFITHGAVYLHNTYEYPYAVKTESTGAQLAGIGCYPGVVENRIKLIFSPDDELDLNGQILCTVRTDPGWAPLFPTAGGILVERGSTLSHSAVVARELGIPAIVNIPGLTKILKNGELVRMDGTKGIIERLEADKPGREV